MNRGLCFTVDLERMALLLEVPGSSSQRMAAQEICCGDFTGYCISKCLPDSGNVQRSLFPTQARGCNAGAWHGGMCWETQSGGEQRVHRP